MLYIVKYNNPTSFMKEWAKDPNIKLEKDGKITSTSTSYKKSNVPGTKVLFSPKCSSSGKMLIDMDQATINKEIEKINFYNKDGVQIKEAPLGTQNHDFWKSEHAHMWIEGGEARLDDTLPKDKIMLAAMRLDNEFWFKGSQKPFLKGVHKWIVYPVNGAISEIVEEETESMKAVKVLFPMDHEKAVNIARVMGRSIDIKTDPDVVKATLYRLITAEKDLPCVDGKTNLQKFQELSLGKQEGLNLEALANDSKAFFEKRGGYY